MNAHTVILLTIPGNPLPKERPRSRGGQSRSFTPKKTRDAEKVVAAAFQAAYPGWEPLAAQLTVTGEFFRATRQWVDTDNLLKLATDALNGLAYVDDKQIDDLRGIRHLGVGVAAARTVLRIGISNTPTREETK